MSLAEVGGELVIGSGAVPGALPWAVRAMISSRLVALRGEVEPRDEDGRGGRMLGEDFAEVLSGALDGDERAFARLFTDAHPPLLRYLRGMAPDFAEDAASETWLEVARGLGGFTGPEPAFRAWLFAIARRKVIDRIRYETRRPSATWEDLDAVAPAERDVAEEIVQDDDTRRALAMVRTLPPDQAEAVLLRVVGGLDYAEVAAVMDRSTGAVRVLVHRGLKRLQRTLAETADAEVTP